MIVTTIATRKMGKLAQGSPEEVAIARSRCYQFLARAFAFPQPSFFQEVKAGRWREETEVTLAALPYRLPLPAAFLRPLRTDYDVFQSEYIRLFEVGRGGGAPCPLHSGHYARDRLRVMEELVRFFNFFGLRLAQGKLPDHITVELEFMHYLTYKEAEACQGDGDVDSYRRAQRDFLARHLANWLPLLAAALAAHKPLPFFASLVNLTNRFLQADITYLKQQLRGR